MMLVLLGWSAIPAEACGGLAVDESSLAESNAAEALFETLDGTVRVTYEVSYHGDATELGWVIPVPGEALSVDDGDPTLFDALRSFTQPTVERYDSSESDSGGVGCMCGGGGSKGLDGASNEAPFEDVEVVAQGFTGTYEYVVINAANSETLGSWLADNGWANLPEDALDHYLEAGDSFVAVRVQMGAGSSEEERMLPPIRIEYAGEVLSYPAVMAGSSSGPVRRTTLYVVSDTRATISGGWTSEDPQVVDGGLHEDPLALWDAYLTEVGETRGYVRTSAGLADSSVPELTGPFVTRFDTLAPAAVHDADVALALEDSTDWIGARIVLQGESEGQATVPFALLLLGAGVGIRRTTTRRGSSALPR